MISKLMIMCFLYTPELKLTTCSLCSIHDPYSTLETPVNLISSQNKSTHGLNLILSQNESSSRLNLNLSFFIFHN